MKTHNTRLTVSPATLKDVAQRAGVSHSTVSRAINHPNLLNEETLEAVRGAIKELDYTPNPFARGLQTSSSKTVALIVPNMQNLAFANFAAGAQKNAGSGAFQPDHSKFRRGQGTRKVYMQKFKLPRNRRGHICKLNRRTAAH